jgi:hypothetical protein
VAVYNPQVPGPLSQIALGAAIGLLAFGAFVLCQGCGATNPQLVQCKLDALKILPDDPRMVTPYDGVDLINRLKACELAPSGDAGAK